MTNLEIAVPASGMFSMILTILFFSRAGDEWRSIQNNPNSSNLVGRHGMSRRRKNDVDIANFWFCVKMGLGCMSYSMFNFFLSKHLFG